MKAGGMQDNFNTATSKAYRLDAGAASPTWSEIGDPGMQYHNGGGEPFLNKSFYLVLLPDGRVLAIGGTGEVAPGGPEMIDPNAATPAWSVMATPPERRGYHSSAILLADGSVFIGGGNSPGCAACEQRTGRRFFPPYLYKADDQRISDTMDRPQVSAEPTLVGTGSTFPVTVTGGDGTAIAKASLIRLGAATHSWDHDARYIPLAFTPSVGNLTVTAPRSPEEAPPGYYMLLFTNNSTPNGRPSKAKYVRVWSIRQGSISHSNLQVLDQLRFRITIDWDAMISATTTDYGIFYPPSGGAPITVPCSQSCVTGLHHTATFEVTGCETGYWSYEVRSGTTAPNSSSSQSLKTSATRFRILNCLD